ncbi:peroxidase-related enzyme [Actinoplanes sp. TRM 88003]|uniref:Peroxidase-related enzyme n=1 Tax=Paractinoplanes aksuensis TaxID=2939490 RepID=A0ABT1DTX6_9ACTN|nr:peroxidase-related enzyme [Actinoplanes aksuensis]MCO8274308.1 peroxidase-related enzyme [Actinoplanes aksuensis]
MAYIDLGLDETVNPGIRGLLRYRPATGRPLMELAEALLRGPSTLSRGERELVAAYVSDRNDCTYCHHSHGAFAAAQLEEGRPLVDQVCADPSTAPIPEKLRALLKIAAATQVSGHDVTPSLIEDARAAGATDAEIHDVVLIAAAFSMFNRYVDALGTLAPTDRTPYEAAAPRVVESGYLA